MEMSDYCGSDSEELEVLGSKLGVSLLSVADCPLLLALLSRLADRMEGSGAVSGTSSRGLQAARAKREAARARYTGLKVRVDTLEEFVVESQLSSLTLPLSRREAGLVSALQENLSAAAVANWLDSKTGPALLGIKQEASASTAQDPQFGLELQPLLESHLSTKLEGVFSLLEVGKGTGGAMESSSCPALFQPRLLGLADRVADLQAGAREGQDRSAGGQDWAGAAGQQRAAVGRLVAAATELANTHYTGSRAQHSAALVRKLASSVEAILLKLEVTRLEILQATYPRDTVSALTALRARLEKEMRVAKEELGRVRASLAQYQRCGPEMTDLVKQFTQLQLQLEGKQWALRELTGPAAL